MVTKNVTVASNACCYDRELLLLPAWVCMSIPLPMFSSFNEFVFPYCIVVFISYALYVIPPTLLEILTSYLTNILPSLTKLHLYPKPVTITFVNFAVSGLTSIRQLPVPLLPLSFTPNLITVILSTINQTP